MANMQLNTRLEGIQGGVNATQEAVNALNTHATSTENARVNLRANFGGEPGDIYDRALVELQEVILGVRKMAQDLHGQLEASLAQYTNTHGTLLDQSSALQKSMTGLEL